MRSLPVLSCCMVAAILFCAGCAGPSGIPSLNGVTPTPTNEPAPLPSLPPVSLQALPITAATPYATISLVHTPPVYTPAVTPYPQPSYRTSGYTAVSSTALEPYDPQSIVFRHYSDQNFAIDYPSTWTFTQVGYLRFTSESGKVMFNAEVSDFLPGYAGNVRLNPDIAAAQDLVSREFPGYDAKNIIYDYQNTMVNGVPVTMYSVRTSSVAYRRYLFVTLSHAYQFTFISDPATFDRAAPLREYMFGTLTLHDQA
jgi:hypothetical protein